MRARVATHTKSDEIVFSVISESTPCSDVMDFEVGHAATLLAAPAVPF